VDRDPVDRVIGDPVIEDRGGAIEVHVRGLLIF
jgi:hypothetical protein